VFERVLNGVVKVLRNSLDLETISRRNGWLQSADPRFVFVLLISLLVVAVLLKNPLSLLAVIIFANAMALTSRVPMRWYLKRVWLFIPLFTVMILLPSMTNLITPGRMVGQSISLLDTTVYFTLEGLLYALTFTLRVGAAVSLSILLVASVEWSKLMRALAQLGFPSSFITILDMAYRYIHVLLDTVANMFMARKSRMVGKPTTAELRNIGGSSVASLFSKSLHMSEQVYLAMLSRGYAGDPKILSTSKSGWRDYALVAAIIAFGAVVVLFDLFAAQVTYKSLLATMGVYI